MRQVVALRHGCKIQQKPGRQINHGLTHIDHFAQIKCGSELAREGGLNIQHIC